jgi:alkanesulfonate monooxygenase SsuD/methylene tetrahydromethanopterin reductase-like flavin-dependent oxidoreductase (luciferase family)
MKFGVSVATVGAFADPAIQRQLVRRAEHAGWDGYFVWDGTMHAHRPLFEPWTGLAALAAMTDRITLGPLVSAVSFHRPRTLAASIATVWRISHGRLVVGAGAGDVPDTEMSTLGEPLRAARIAALDGVLEQVRSLLSAEHCAVPFWIAASDPTHGRAALRRAARYDGVCPTGLDREPAEVRAMAAYFARYRSGPVDIALFASLVTKHRASAPARIAAYADAGATWLIDTLVPWVSPVNVALDLLREGPPRLC